MVPWNFIRGPWHPTATDSLDIGIFELVLEFKIHTYKLPKLLDLVERLGQEVSTPHYQIRVFRKIRDVLMSCPRSDFKLWLPTHQPFISSSNL